MANDTREYVTVIKLNATEARDNLEMLQKKVADLAAMRDKAIAAKQDSNFVKELSKDLRAAKAELKSYDNNVRKTVETLNNISTASLGEVKTAMRSLQREMNKTTDPDDYRRLNGLLEQCKDRMDQFKDSTGQSNAEIRKMVNEAQIAANVINNINGSSVNDLRSAQSTIQTRMAGMNPSSASYARQNEDLLKIKARLQEIGEKQKIVNTIVDEYNAEIRQAGQESKKVATNTELVNRTMKNLSTSSVDDLKFSLRIVNDEMKSLGRGTKEFRAMQQQAKLLNRELQRTQVEGAAQQGWMSRMANFANKWQAAVFSLAASLTGLTLTIRKTVSDFAEMEDVLASTRKYTGLADDQVRELNEGFKKMDTRSSRKQLNDFAGEAGRLGIQSKEAIAEFVDGADKISVALGDDLGDGAVETIGKLAMAFGEDKKMGLRGAMLATGSALNELSQSSSANGGYIVDFTARLAGMGIQAKISQQNTMGFASVLDQNMQEAETSATAFGQLITKMFQDPAKFAKLAGQNVKEFTDLLSKDANQALLKFFEAMQAKGGFKDLAPMFSQMGLEGNRAVGVLSTMAAKLDDVRAAQSVANKAYADGTSVTKEFNYTNNTANAQLDKAKKNFMEISIELGQKLMPIARYGITTTSTVVKVLSSLIDFTQKYWKVLVVLTGTITAFTIAANARLIVSKAENVYLKLGIALEKVHVGLLKAKTAVTTVLSVATQLLTGKITLANAAQKLFNKTVLGNPYLLAAAAAIGLTAALAKFTTKASSAEKVQKDINKAIKEGTEQATDEEARIISLTDTIKSQVVSERAKKEALDELNGKLMDAHLNNITAEEVRTGKANRQLETYIKNYKQKIILQGLEKKLSESIAKEAEAYDTIDKINEFGSKPKNIFQKIAGWAGNVTNDDNQYYIQKQQEKIDQEKEYQTLLRHRMEMNQSYDDFTVYKPGDANRTKDANKADSSGGNYVDPKEAAKLAAKQKQLQTRQERERKAALKKDLEDAKAHNAQLQEANILAYQKGDISYREYVEKQHKLNIDGFDGRIEVLKKYNEDYRQLTDDRAREELEAQQQHNDFLLKDAEKAYRQQVAMAEAEYNNPDSIVYRNDDVLNERLFEAEMSAMADKLAIYSKGSQEWIETRDAMETKEEEHSIDLQRSYAEKLEQYREAWGKRDVAAQEKVQIDGLKLLLEKKLIKEKEYQEMLRRMKLHYAEMKSEDDLQNSPWEVTKTTATTAYNTARNEAEAEYQAKRPNGPTLVDYFVGDIDIYKSTLQKLQEMEDSTAITHNEHMQAMANATGDLTNSIAQKAQMAYEAVSGILNGMSSVFSAQADYEVNVTQKKYEKLIEKAGNNSAKKQKLQEKEEKEIAKIKTAANKKAMTIEIAQAFASTALAAINAYESAAKIPFVGHTLAPIAAAAATAAGMLQIEAIKKQQQVQEAGYYEGGFTGGNDYRRRAGIVHQGEFVANHDAVANSRILPALQLIDKAQRNNTVGRLTEQDVSRSLGQGDTTVVSAPTVNVVNDNELGEMITEANALLQQLSTVLASGIQAKVSIDGQEGVKHQLDRYNKLMSNK